MILRIAGRLGIDPDPFTFRDLAEMDRGRAEEDWRQNAWLCHVIANRLGAVFDAVRAPHTRRGSFRSLKPQPPSEYNPLILSRRKAKQDDVPEITMDQFIAMVQQ